jgi:hypothetical protein
LTKYGSVYLSSEEYEKRPEKVLQNYYSFLGQSVFFHLREKQFWNYHLKALSHTGFPLSLLRLIKASVLEIVDTLLNPIRMAAKIFRIIPKSVNR